MDISNFKDMDSNILLSIVNMKLRDNFLSLDELVKYYDIEIEDIIEKLEKAGYKYNTKNNQFI